MSEKKNARKPSFQYRGLPPEQRIQEAVAELRKEGLAKGELRSKRLEVSIEEQGAPWVRRLRSTPPLLRLWPVYLLVIIFAGLLAWHLISTPNNPPPRHATAAPAEAAAPSQPQPSPTPPKPEPQPATPQVPQPSPNPPEPAPVPPPPVPRPSPSANAFLGVVKSGDLSTVRSLLDQGANPNAADENGATALMWAAKIGNLGIVKTLIAKGADPKKKGVIYTDEKKQSWYGNFLCAAAGEDHEDIVRYGLEVLKIPVDDQEINPKDGKENGWTALFYAASNGNAPLLRELLAKGAKVDVRDANGGTVLYYAAGHGNAEVVKALVEAHADVKTTDKDGWTPLHSAAKNHPEVIALLVRAGADVNAASSEENGRYTPLHVACWEDAKDPVASVKALLEAGANLNAKDKDGWTPLMTAAKDGYKDACELLISKGADLTAKSNKGNTAADLASQAGHEDIAKLLAGGKPQITPRDKTEQKIYDKFGVKGVAVWRLIDGKTNAEEIMNMTGVSENNLLEMLDWFKEQGFVTLEHPEPKMPPRPSGGKSPTAKLFHGLTGNDLQEVKDSLAEGANVNARNEDDMTPLMVAARDGFTKACELLISKGADVNAKDNNGQTPLMWAAGHGHKDVCELLISKGADINAQDENGKTALGHAVQIKEDDVAAFLRSKGAKE